MSRQVVTFLEMTERPPPLALARIAAAAGKLDAVDPDRYRTLFRRVGANWLWFSRLAMDDATLMAERSPEVNAGHRPTAGGEAGFVELDFRTARRMSDPVPRPGSGTGGPGTWPLAVRADARHGLAGGRERVRVHTCTPRPSAALPAYLRAGFRACSRAFESFPDPRLTGMLPRDCAPQVPLLG
jgi:hypothetical protein